MDIVDLRQYAMEWKNGGQKYMLMNTTATDDVIDVVSQLVESKAITGQDGKTHGMRIPKDASCNELLERVHSMADRCPDALVCLENTDFHEAWGLTAKATSEIEMLHSRTNPSPCFELPPSLPPIASMTSYQLVLMLEDNFRFSWCPLPRKLQDRIGISFLPRDAGSPRFWCSSKAKIVHMYLRSLVAAASDSSLDIIEVKHGEGHGFYLELLGLDVQTQRAGKLAIDDGEGDFPSAKRGRGLKDADDGVPAFEDEELEEALCALLDEDESGMLLDANVNADIIEEQAHDIAEDLPEAGVDDVADDGVDDAANDYPEVVSQYNHTWGAFTFTMKRTPLKKGGVAYAWQCACPFHKLSQETGCRKTKGFDYLGTLSFEAEAERVIENLKHWANNAKKYKRQRHHRRWDVMDHEVPSVDIITAQMITSKPDPGTVVPDDVLDGEQEDHGSSSSGHLFMLSLPSSESGCCFGPFLESLLE